MRKELKHLKKRGSITLISKLVKLCSIPHGNQGLSENSDPQTIEQHAEVAIKGATVARNARLEMEEVLGEKVVTSHNAKSIQKSIEDKNEND